MTTGDRLRLEREKKGWNQLQAAKILGISNAALSNYERDVRQPDYEMLRRFARVFGTSTDYLLGYSAARRPTLAAHGKTLDDSRKAPLVPLFELPFAEPEQPFSRNNQIGSFPLIASEEPENYFCVKINCDHAPLTLLDEGDILLCKKQETIDSGAVMLAQTPSDPVIIARFYEDHQRFIILSENTKIPPRIIQKKEANILGRVIAGVHYYK